MDFFKQLAGISDELNLTLKIKSKSGKITICIIPEAMQDMTPLVMTGTPEELDEGFMKVARQPLTIAAGIQTNADEFEKSANEVAEKKRTKKPAPSESEKQSDKKAEKQTPENQPAPKTPKEKTLFE